MNTITTIEKMLEALESSRFTKVTEALEAGRALLEELKGQEPSTEQQAYDMGANGGEPTEDERLLFEAWMRGHCWAVIGKWDGKTYVHEQEANGFINASAMHTRCLWAAWRDRAALGHPQPAQPKEQA
jgi:hypothetical protein